MTIESKLKLCLAVVIVLTLVLIGGRTRLQVQSRVNLYTMEQGLYNVIKEQNYTHVRNVTRSFNVTTRYKCTLVKPRLSPTPLPVTGLISFPGAGNTWTRHLIQQATGLATASVYCDGSLRRHDFPFECHRKYSQVVAVKSHYANRHVDKFSRVVLILRNPINNLLAFFNFDNGGHTGIAPASAFVNKWPTFFTNRLKQWTNFNHKWLCNFTKPLHTVLYENLQNDPYTELKNLFEFLRLKVNESSILCAIRNQEGNFHRKSTTSLSKRPKHIFSEAILTNAATAAEHIAECFHKRFGIAWNYFPKKT